MATDSTVDPDMRAIVSDTSNRFLLACLEQILEEPQRLLETARSSYRHQLGFQKFLLQHDESGRALRLHLWDRSVIVQEDIHSHCADFISRVVCGELKERRFALVPGKRFTRFRYRFDARAGHALAHADGMADVVETTAIDLAMGTVYQRRADELHTVASALKNTITVSAWGARDSEAVVFKPAGARSEDCAASAGMAPDQVKNVLTHIYRSLHVAA